MTISLDDDDEDRSISSEEGKVLLSLFPLGKDIGSSFYSTTEDPSNIHCIISLKDSIDMNIIESAILALNVTTLLIPSQVSQAFLSGIRSLMKKIEDSTDFTNIELVVMMKKDYSKHIAFTIFHQLNSSQYAEQYPYSISALSGLLSYMKGCDGPWMKVPNFTIIWDDFDEIMVIDYDTILSLQIIGSEIHPNMHFKSSNENGLSLFGKKKNF